MRAEQAEHGEIAVHVLPDEARWRLVAARPLDEHLLLAVDDVRVVAAGRLRRQLTEEEIDSLGHVDVLVIPVGGGDALGAIEAAKLVNAVEPGIVVPARYGAGDGGEYDPVGKFAQEMGLAEGAWEPQPRLVLTGSSGESDETRVVFLEARAG